MPLLKENPKLLNFFIFNAKFGQKEGHEHEKLLYYYPHSESLDSQVRNVGLAEAITRFTSTFNKKDDCESMHTQKIHQVYYQAEPSIWMVMKNELDLLVRRLYKLFTKIFFDHNSKNYIFILRLNAIKTVSVEWVQREKDSGPVREYNSEGVQDQVLKAQLLNIYKLFKLQHFAFTSLIEKEELSSVKDTLKCFFDDCLSSKDLVNGNILTMWSGVCFSILDRHTFLRVHCTLSLIQTTFPSIVHTAYLYKNHFAWCGFSRDDLQSLYKYLMDRLSSGPQEYVSLSQSSSTSQSSCNSGKSSSSRSYYSGFLGDDPTPSTVVYIQDRNNVTKPHHLVIYVSTESTVCLSFPAEEKLSSSMFEKLERLLDSGITELTSDIKEQVNKRPQTENARYLYHNRMNLATNSTVYGVLKLPVETMQTIVDMHSDLFSQGSSELIMKTALDHWVVGRAGNGREYYIVVVNQKNANLVEITDEVNRLCDFQFSNIFMSD